MYTIGTNHLVNAVTAPLGFFYAILAVISMFYPLSGFLADVYCGRFKTIVIGLTIMSISSVTLAAVSVGWIGMNGIHQVFMDTKILSPEPGNKFFVAGCGAALFIVVLGYTAYQANFIQLGLDQLLEAPSISLSLFIHWAIWADTVGAALMGLCSMLLTCYQLSAKIKASVFFVQYFVFLCLGVPSLTIIACWKRHWIHTESPQHNPYKTVIKVLKFVRNHKYPLQRSAFTYCDDERPSRFDYAKERFGGPYTTEKVEDVKTFVRILILLATLGPVFVMEIQSSVIGFDVFGTHTVHQADAYFRCTTVWIFFESGGLRYVVGSIFLPMYIYFLAKKSSKMFTRLYLSLIHI